MIHKRGLFVGALLWSALGAMMLSSAVFFGQELTTDLSSRVIALSWMVSSFSVLWLYPVVNDD